jgi:hypothetical protein
MGSPLTRATASAAIPSSIAGRVGSLFSSDWDRANAIRRTAASVSTEIPTIQRVLSDFTFYDLLASFLLILKRIKNPCAVHSLTGEDPESSIAPQRGFLTDIGQMGRAGQRRTTKQNEKAKEGNSPDSPSASSLPVFVLY